MADKDRCDYCGKELGFTGWHSSLTRFCDEEHRNAYHMTMRKIERKKQAYYRLIGELQQIRDTSVSHDIIKQCNDILFTIGADDTKQGTQK